MCAVITGVTSPVYTRAEAQNHTDSLKQPARDEPGSHTRQQPAREESSGHTQQQQSSTRLTTATPGRQSWTSDKRDFRIGDIVTILVDEYTLTSLSKRIDASDSRKRDISVALNTPTKTTSVAAGGGNNSSSYDRGSDARTNRIATEMTARVIEISENGLMKLAGSKTIGIEKSTIKLELSGWARSEDVQRNNTIQSFRMADSQIAYQAEGPLASSKKSIISRLLGKVWP